MHNPLIGTQASKLERWMPHGQLEAISNGMKDWYGGPIPLSGVPGNVWACPGGDFRGPIRAGQLGTALDYAIDRFKGRYRRWLRAQLSTANTGFASLSDLLSEATTGGKRRDWTFLKSGSTGVAGATNSLWRVGLQPIGGSTPSAAPGGNALDDTATGTWTFTNPGSPDTQHFLSGWVVATVGGNTLLLYDRIFHVAKTMSSTGTEAVTGVPTRYQNTTQSADDHAGNNFLFIETPTALGATAHNWTVCTYTDQSGNTGATLPTVTGNASCIQDRLDMQLITWFCSLASGDWGIQKLTQMQCSASVTGAINFVMGHPLAWMPVPIATMACIADGLQGGFNPARIFDDACLSFLEIIKPTTTATAYTGQFVTVAG